MFGWVTRCLPGFSIVGLAVLLVFAFSDVLTSSLWKSLFPPVRGGTDEDSPWADLNLAQRVFVVYAVLVHVAMFSFTLRLAWSLYGLYYETRYAYQRRVWDSPPSSPGSSSREECSDDPLPLTPPPSQPSADPSISKNNSPDPNPNPTLNLNLEVSEEVVHAIILPNYCEDIHTLQTTLKVLASHPRARSQYEVYLAMEQKEAGAAEKAAKLVSAFEKCFRHVRTTFHTVIEGEIAGKSSNVAFAARRIMEVHRSTLQSESCNVIATVMDADTHLSQDYFTEIRRLHYQHITEADRSIYCCPIIFDRNSHESPILVRCADLLWGFAGLSTMFPGSSLAIPTSVYSLPLSLAEKVGGWDSDPTAIGEDMHMLLKCYFETAGNVVSRVIYVPASQCNVSSDQGRGWRRTVDTLRARYRQALRHMWGSLDSGFAVRRSVGYLRFHRRCLFLRPRHFALLHLLWEAHFLPCHLAILMIFSTFYTLWNPAVRQDPVLSWAFSFTDTLRTCGFLGMNVCLGLYERWHALSLNARMQDMHEANIYDTGCSRRNWSNPKYLAERIIFPVAGTLFGAVPTLHAVFSHFYTDRLVYRVSKKPSFALSDATMV